MKMFLLSFISFCPDSLSPSIVRRVDHCRRQQSHVPANATTNNHTIDLLPLYMLLHCRWTSEIGDISGLLPRLTSPCSRPTVLMVKSYGGSGC